MLPPRVLALALITACAPAAIPPGPTPDSGLVYRILAAEDRRDASDPALALGVAHADGRIRALARRATWRIADPAFRTRDSLPSLAAPPVWPEPGWRLRYRALAARRTDCGHLGGALQDSVWPVRLRAAGLLTAACGSDDGIVSALRGWVDALPADTRTRRAGSVSWHAGAHGIVALARVRPAEARSRTQRLAAHGQWQVRMYTARAAAILADTALLRRLARDPGDDVKEAAIGGLSQLTGHADDSLYLAALDADGAQAVRAAAIALKGSPRADVAQRASATFERWVRRANASERDARVALLEAAGRPATDDRPPTAMSPLPRETVALALGAVRNVRVTMSAASGGGSFVVRMRGDNAPIMAARVLDLVRRRYYDGGNWHRVEHDFVIQGAAPGSNEYVGHREYLRDELGNVPHVRGAVGMSTRAHHTGDAQWFINLKDNLRLIADYTVFAEVIEGIEVVDGIMEGDVVATMRVEQ